MKLRKDELLTFDDMYRYDINRLRNIRTRYRDILSSEIHKRDALKAEILFLQNEILKYQVEEK